MKLNKNLILFFFTIITIAPVYCQKVELLGAESCCLYADVANPIKIVVDGKVLKAKDYTVELNQGTFEKTDTCLWVKVVGYNTTVTIKDKNGKLITQKSYNKIYPPEPEISIDGVYKGGDITKQELTASSGFVAVLRDFSYPIQYKVKSYHATLKLGTETRIFSCDGSLISDSIRFYLTQMKPTDRVEFYDFALTNYRRVFSPLVFGINDYSGLLYDYENLFYDFKDRKYDNYHKVIPQISGKSISNPRQLYHSLPWLAETDCNYSTDSCNTKIFYRIDGVKALAFNYVFTGNDTVRVKWYFENVLMADIGYWKNTLNGPFALYYENGQKRVEGMYKIGGVISTDTVMRINPLTYEEHYQFLSRVFTAKEGEWRYFNNDGQIVLRRSYKKDNLIEN